MRMLIMFLFPCRFVFYKYALTGNCASVFGGRLFSNMASTSEWTKERLPKKQIQAERTLADALLHKPHARLAKYNERKVYHDGKDAETIKPVIH